LAILSYFAQFGLFLPFWSILVVVLDFLAVLGYLGCFGLFVWFGLFFFFGPFTVLA